MRRFLPKLTVKTKLVLLAALSAALLLVLLYLQGWPTLTAVGTLRRLEREHLSPRGEVVLRGGVDWPQETRSSGYGNHWMVTQTADGEYAVAVLERFWGVLWRPAEYVQSYHRPAQYPQSAQSLYTVDVTFANIVPPKERLFGWFHAFLVFSSDGAVTRVTVTEAALPTEEQGDPVPYIEANGTATDCTQVAPGIWLGQHTFPQPDLGPNGGGSSAPWTILRGYGADGALLYEYFPEPRVKE